MLFRSVAEELACRIVSERQLVHLIGSGDKMLLDEFANFGVGPGQLPVFHAVESGHAAGMPVHDPQQYGFLALACFDDGFAQIGTPRDCAPARFFLRTDQSLAAPIVILCIQIEGSRRFLSQRRCTRGEQKQSHAEGQHSSHVVLHDPSSTRSLKTTHSMPKSLVLNLHTSAERGMQTRGIPA